MRSCKYKSAMSRIIQLILDSMTFDIFWKLFNNLCPHSIIFPLLCPFLCHLNYDNQTASLVGLNQKPTLRTRLAVFYDLTSLPYKGVFTRLMHFHRQIVFIKSSQVRIHSSFCFILPTLLILLLKIFRNIFISVRQKELKYMSQSFIRSRRVTDLSVLDRYQYD